MIICIGNCLYIEFAAYLHIIYVVYVCRNLRNGKSDTGHSTAAGGREASSRKGSSFVMVMGPSAWENVES